jgi:ATP-dependent RNA helicase
MSGINTGDERLVFESSEAVSVVPTFDELGLKEDLLRGIYAYSTLSLLHHLRCLAYIFYRL